jgi:hypothetical protein
MHCVAIAKIKFAPPAHHQREFGGPQWGKNLG